MNLIKKEDIVSKATYMYGFGANKYVSLNAIDKAEVVDAVPRSVYEQVCWERDMAMKQLEDIGVGFGEKVTYGHWIYDVINGDPIVKGGRVYRNDIPTFKCSECKAEFAGVTYGFNYCPNCGIKMEDLNNG